jgi:Kef-type K+ transport system membrane component KefB
MTLLAAAATAASTAVTAVQTTAQTAAPHAASTVHQNELLLYFVLLQLVVIVLAGRIGGQVAVRVGQIAAVGEIIIGILLGPSLFGAIAPDTFSYVFRSVPATPLTILSQIGLILLMFQIGLEFDFTHLTEKRHRKVVWGVAAAGMIAPFALGYGFGWLVAPVLSPNADPVASALFVAVAFSITALPILGRMLIDLKLSRTPLGVIAISAAAINDVVGWLLLAMVTSITVSAFSTGAFTLKVALVAVFFLASWFVVRPLMLRVIRMMTKADDALPHSLIGVLLALVFIGAMTTFQLGIFSIFGGFMMGVILFDQRELVAAWNQRIGAFVMVFFLPIFFTYTGLRTDIGGLTTATDWGWCLLLIVLATAGKFGGCYFAARAAGLPRAESGMLGIMMNTRALMELIVLNVGLDLGVISPQMFTMLVLMAIVSTVITTPALRMWMPKVAAASRAESPVGVLIQ